MTVIDNEGLREGLFFEMTPNVERMLVEYGCRSWGGTVSFAIALFPPMEQDLRMYSYERDDVEDYEVEDDEGPDEDGEEAVVLDDLNVAERQLYLRGLNAMAQIERMNNDKGRGIVINFYREASSKSNDGSLFTYIPIAETHDFLRALSSVEEGELKLTHCSHATGMEVLVKRILDEKGALRVNATLSLNGEAESVGVVMEQWAWVSLTRSVRRLYERARVFNK